MPDTDSSQSEAEADQSHDKPTHVKVRLALSRKVDLRQTVRVDQIIEFQSNPPKDCLDYIKQKMYKCELKDDTGNTYVDAVQIGWLAAFKTDPDSQQLAQFHNKRGNFVRLEESLLNEYKEQEKATLQAASTIKIPKRKILTQEEKEQKERLKNKNTAFQNEILRKKIEQNQVKHASKCLDMKMQKFIVRSTVNMGHAAAGDLNMKNTDLQFLESQEAPVNSDVLNMQKRIVLLQTQLQTITHERDALEKLCFDHKQRYIELNKVVKNYRIINEKLQFQILSY